MINNSNFYFSDERQISLFLKQTVLHILVSSFIAFEDHQTVERMTNPTQQWKVGAMNEVDIGNGMFDIWWFNWSTGLFNST